MTKLYALALAASMFATPALADTVTYDGTTYTYSVEQKGANQLIKGTDSVGKPFTLVVSRGWVNGTVDGRSVSFSKREVKPLAGATTSSEIAAR